MNFYIMTLFPDMVMQGLNTSIIGRAAEKGLLTIEEIYLNRYAGNRETDKKDNVTAGLHH